MVTVDDAIIAKMDKDGKHFEVLVDPEIAYELRAGKNVSVSDMLAVNRVFKDASKGNKMGFDELENVFDTSDVKEITKHIVKYGDIQLTTKFKRKKKEEKRRRIVAYISKNSINPQIKAPNPPERISNAMDKAGVKIDAFEPVEEQIDGIIKSLKKYLPISLQKISLNIKIPARYSGQAYGLIKKYNVKESNWLEDGTLSVVVNVLPGLKNTIYSKLESLTHGEALIKEK